MREAASWLTGSELLYHAKELSEQIDGHLHLIFSCSQEERGYWEAGADCREIVVGINCAAVWEVGTWNEGEQRT